MTGPSKLSRRELLRGKFIGSLLDAVHGAIPHSVDSQKEATLPQSTGQAFPVLRPPGAVDEQAFLAGCTRCDACIKACPHDAIVHAPPRFRHAAGTPMIDPVRQPCMMCEGFPCIAACEPNVLQMALTQINGWRMGEASIETFLCLAHQRTTCTVCLERCPVEGAIELQHGKPHINPNRCTGCGVCQHVCPAPQNAILLMPLAQRPHAVTGEPQP